MAGAAYCHAVTSCTHELLGNLRKGTHAVQLPIISGAGAVDVEHLGLHVGNQPGQMPVLLPGHIQAGCWLVFVHADLQTVRELKFDPLESMLLCMSSKSVLSPACKCLVAEERLNFLYDRCLLVMSQKKARKSSGHFQG